MGVKKVLIAALIVSFLMSGNVFAGEWKMNQGRWWYQNDDYSYPAGGWNWIDGRCYYFDGAGYCLIDTVTPDGYIVDGTGAWTVNGVVQERSWDPSGNGAYMSVSWTGIYIADDGQTIVVTATDASGVYMTFTGYSEEGWYSETQKLLYKNVERTQVGQPRYHNGNVVEETVYTLTEAGIEVKVLPAGGWKDGTYIRQ